MLIPFASFKSYLFFTDYLIAAFFLKPLVIIPSGYDLLFMIINTAACYPMSGTLRGALHVDFFTGHNTSIRYAPPPTTLTPTLHTRGLKPERLQSYERSQTKKAVETDGISTQGIQARNVGEALRNAGVQAFYMLPLIPMTVI